jgi:NAD(P)-dependent dehydrogenase (short-subunit alcohol dehydrogenase family)
MGIELDGKRVLITGSSSGIGAALAVGFAERGAIVGICGRRSDRLAAVLEKCHVHSPESRSWTVDLADLHGLEAFAATVTAELGGVDIVVNNAGIPKRRWAWELTGDVVDEVMSINFSSPVRLTLALLPQIIERSGAIVNVSSVAARLSPPAEASYAASKAALTAFSEGLRVDLAVAGEQVGVHVLNPGVVDTELFGLPDNDASIADVEPVPVTDVIEPVVDMLRTGTFEAYVPAWFADVVPVKFPDTTAYLEGSIASTRDRPEQLGLNPGVNR